MGERHTKANRKISNFYATKTIQNRSLDTSSGACIAAPAGLPPADGAGVLSLGSVAVDVESALAGATA